MEKPVVFKNNKGQQLVGTLHFSKKEKKSPAVIICHGFSGSKSQLKFVKLSRELSKKNVVSLRFDFSGHSDSEGEAENFTIKQGIKDLEAGFKFLSRLSFVDKRRIGLLGHSLAGVIVSLFATNHPEIKTMVFWAPALNQKKLFKKWYTPDQIKKMQKQGYLDLEDFRIGIKYFDEAKNRDFTDETTKLKIPILIIHGIKDDVVPVNESRRLFKLLNYPKKLLIIKGGDHTLERYDIKQKVVKATVNWLLKYLK